MPSSAAGVELVRQAERLGVDSVWVPEFWAADALTPLAYLAAQTSTIRLATGIAVAVVLVELWIIAWIRARYMDTPFLQAAFQIVVGGILVFVTGIVIGSA